MRGALKTDELKAESRNDNYTALARRGVIESEVRGARGRERGSQRKLALAEQVAGGQRPDLTLNSLRPLRQGFMG